MSGITSNLRHILHRSMVSNPRIPILITISLGGIIGALSRYRIGLLYPTAAGTFPWSTFIINITGCALMGVVMVWVNQILSPQRRFLQSFLGTGFLGGYTTFSTFTGDIYKLAITDHLITALIYLIFTPLAALVATSLADKMTRLILQRRIL